MNTEPAITIGAITSIVGAFLGAMVAFGVNVTADQQKAILGLFATSAPIVVGLLTRRKVAPTAASSASPTPPPGGAQTSTAA